MNAALSIIGSAQLGQCPAAVSVDQQGNALFVTNRDVFPRLTLRQQYFILAHEVGHWLLLTSDECVADAFALGLTAGRQHRSLKSALEAVASMDTVPTSRLHSLHALCLLIDQSNQSNQLS